MQKIAKEIQNNNILGNKRKMFAHSTVNYSGSVGKEEDTLWDIRDTNTTIIVIRQEFVLVSG